MKAHAELLAPKYHPDQVRVKKEMLTKLAKESSCYPQRDLNATGRNRYSGKTFFNTLNRQNVDYGQVMCGRCLFLLLGHTGRWNGREIGRSALSLACSAQAERDNESCFFVRAAGVHRFRKRYHLKKKLKSS
ncbi:hypothetical protein EVAR_41206_1 [Eumeta japonica]|uniref:Uncharacterized protein n=1 Tax=Eumeta variegata TaxID=151549 RepID=A0A4C1WSS1_EUMVA|nr:hypothetical protein EVAR_41206_1 [Eumeta japonica]